MQPDGQCGPFSEPRQTKPPASTHQPLERLLIGSAVHRAELRRVPLLEQLFLRSLAARMLVQPAAELLLHLGGHVVVREIGNYVLGLFSHGFFPWGSIVRQNAGAPQSAVILLHILDDPAAQHPYAEMKIKFRKFLLEEERNYLQKMAFYSL